MSTSKVIFNIPTKVKKAATQRAENEGLTLTSVLTQAAQAYGEGRISVAVVETPRLRPEVARRLDRAVDDYYKGRNISPVFTNATDAMRWINASGRKRKR